MAINASERAFLKERFGWEYVPDEDVQYFFPFENIDGAYWVDLATRSKHIVIYIGVVYILTIFGLQRWMRDRAPYKLTTFMFLWNLALGVFSVFAFVRVLPSFLYVLRQNNGFYHSLCTRKFLQVPINFWTLMFALSKFLELGDTVFIVLRKRPLLLVQYYHHLIMMSGTWVIAPMLEPVGRWFPTVNFGVHSLVYNYFALRALNVRVPNFMANIITTLQFLQMIVCAAVNMWSAVLYYQGDDCYREPLSIYFNGVVLITFIYLFGQLFYDFVVKKGRELKEKDRKKVD